MSNHNKTKTVGIIGGSGFIGSYNTRKFLEEGYKVKASVTDKSNREKYQHLHNFPNADHLEIVELDVRDADQLQEFMKGCHIIVHGGTPFQLDVQDPQSELFDPTIKGTENFLKVAQENDHLEKVVFIASVAAFNTDFPMNPQGFSDKDQFSESNPPYYSKESHPYAQAKYLANQTVEKFIKEHPALPFEITSISPVFVIGKSLSQREDSTSSGMQFLFKNKIAPNPFVQMMYDQDVAFAMVDVQDVAEACFAAATKSGLHGKNYLLTKESHKISDISRLLNLHDPQEKPFVFYRNDLAKADLGISFNPAKDALMDLGKVL